MSTRNPDPDNTNDTVRARYRQWADANPRPRGPTAIGMPAGRTVHTGRPAPIGHG